jgi:hypothetical protein
MKEYRSIEVSSSAVYTETLIRPLWDNGSKVELNIRSSGSTIVQTASPIETPVEFKYLRGGQIHAILRPAGLTLPPSAYRSQPRVQ